MTVVAMGSFYVFGHKVSLIWNLPAKFSFLAVTPFFNFLYNLCISLMISFQVCRGQVVIPQGLLFSGKTRPRIFEVSGLVFLVSGLVFWLPGPLEAGLRGPGTPMEG